MANDVLAPLSPAEVAAFYSRLADGVDARKGNLKVSLAAMLMRLWLSNRQKGASLVIDAPEHLQNHQQTKNALMFHRDVYLTQKKARRGSSEVWGGVLPRIQGLPPHPKWNLQQPLSMDYESLTEFPLRYQLTGNDADRDLLYSLHGFQLHSTVTVNGTNRPDRKVRITFSSFSAYALDTYDWDYSEHLTVPNPDFGSQAKGAVEPKSQTVVVYHANAKRIEDAGLAAPYRFQTRPWQIQNAQVREYADVDPSRKLR